MGLRNLLGIAALLATASAPALAAEADVIRPQVTGAFRNPAGGTCEAAFFKSSGPTKTVRGEEAMAGTVTNAGMTINGHLIVQGAREGQMVNPMTDKAIFIFEPQPGDRLKFIPIGEPVLSWPEITLELCPGSRS